MKECKGNIWEYPSDAICITTNGIVKKDGRLVMGGGIALEVVQRYPEIDLTLGRYVKAYGNRCFYIPIDLYNHFVIISFPTKHHYKNDSCIKLIKKSTKELVEIVDKYKLNTIALPKVGCGLGRLNYDKQVKPILSKYLDDRFTIFSF